MKINKLFGCFLIILLLNSLLVGCVGNEEQTSTTPEKQGEEKNSENNTRLFQHFMGETEIPVAWQGLPAVQNNKDYFIVRTQWLSYDPISLKGQLTDSVGIFSQNQ